MQHSSRTFKPEKDNPKYKLIASMTEMDNRISVER